MADEKHIHLVVGNSPGININGPGSVVGAMIFTGFATVEFQLQIAGDWVGLGDLQHPNHIIPQKVRRLTPNTYVFAFEALSGLHMYRWACTVLVSGDVTTYIAG